MLNRWKAVVTYRTDNGPVSFTHRFDEIEDLHNIIEAGPDWTMLDTCVVTYDGSFIEADPFLTTQKRKPKFSPAIVAKGE